MTITEEVSPHECTESKCEAHAHDSEDAMVCYCYRMKLSQVKEAYKRCGSLTKLQESTKVGLGCGGCGVVLHSMFGEKISDLNQLDRRPTHGSLCSKPGTRVMKGFIVADGKLESSVYSSNAVAPQLGDCDTTMTVNYALVDHRGVPVIARTTTIKKNEVFVFDTRKENLPRPFYGSFIYGLGRSNYGAARFNIYWSNGVSTTSTHENGDPGRVRVFLPVPVDQRFLNGNTGIYLGCMNPHPEKVPYSITVMDLNGSEAMRYESYLDPFGSTWINANEFLYGPALKRNPGGKYVLKTESGNLKAARAMVEYMFFHNRETDVWTSNHL